MTYVSITAPAGTFQGRTEDGVNSFHSIAYSHIPGEYAESEPAPHLGEYDATTPRPDAIALTITAPTPRRSGGYPVVVYIHGGRYESGTHEDSRADGTANARAGIVQVQLGYRVGLPGLAKLPEDNYFSYRAIGDCQLGLEWIQKNIAAFGGDPTNVTLVGQSAGATTALWLARRDHYRGAFRRVLAMSPCFPRQGFEHRKATLRRALGAPITKANLEATAPEKVTAGYAKFRKKYRFDMALGPYPLQPEELADIPIVLSSTREEFYDLGGKADISPARRTLAWWLCPRFDMRRERFSTWLDLSGAKSNPLGRLVGDSLIRRWVEQVGARAPGKTWMMEFVRAEGPALHCQELRPLFGVTESLLHGWLVEFARTGEPGFEAYRPDHAVWEFNLDTGHARTTYGTLNYVTQAFQES
ncbi:carboxylesterase [Corynebacterium phocae]|uniref:Carboxylic ester hydrolase n=1 Tax=Corynebacterium phocae TaxID=161895 RepID=A0A1L7D662_9CORY|nr:carboxylesterase family protein [Corynebacterium phocae]APT93638.1 carboxylesterase [Corynebacterium phocae]KAA8726489.1 carboxylesterase family protein [Corynebacterium phocae]